MSVHLTAAEGGESDRSGPRAPDDLDGPDAAQLAATPTTAAATAALRGTPLVDAPLAIYAVDRDGRVRVWNPRAEVLFGRPADEMIGRRLASSDLVVDDDAAGTDTGFVAGAGTARPTPVDARDPADLVTLEHPLVDEDGAPVGTLFLVVDRSPDAATDELVRVIGHKWRSLATRVADVLALADPDGREFETLSVGSFDLGHGADQWAMGRALQQLHPDDIDRATAAWRRVRSVPGRREQLVVRARHFEGHYEQLELTEVNLLDDPAFGRIALAVNRVSDQLHNERLIADEARVLELIARDTPLDEVLPEIIATLEYHCGSAAGIVLLEAGELVLKVAPTLPEGLLETIDTSIIPLEPGSDQTYPALREPAAVVDVEAILGLVEEGPPLSWLNGIIEAGYRAVWTHPIIDPRSDELFGLLLLLPDSPRAPTPYERAACDVVGRLTAIALERDDWRLRIWRQARFDKMTGLPNRAHIFDQLDRMLAEARTTRDPVTAMVLDLDRFMVINDSLGHAVGDDLLVRFAERLRHAVGDAALVGRMAADEFVVAFPAGVRLRDAKLAATAVAEHLHEPFRLGDDDIYLTASIGIASSAQGQENADGLLQRADTAMFRAKALGRDRIEVYDERLRNRAVRRLEVDRELRVALERGELQLYYQPEIDCRTGRIIGAESLLRWHHPQRGVIHPDGFINVAEESGIIVPIGQWVLDEAVRQARTWTDTFPSASPFTVSVNLSARQLINRSLVDSVAFTLTRYAWPPSQLVLELTESILIEDRDATLYVLNRLRLLGVKLAIDDFGTGFASLDYLHRLHVDWIKIDRSFVGMLDADGNGSPVATAMMHMARDFNLLVTAEGVEEQRQFDGLKAIGCDVAQGFLFARPLPVNDFERLLLDGTTW